MSEYHVLQMWLRWHCDKPSLLITFSSLVLINIYSIFSVSFCSVFLFFFFFVFTKFYFRFSRWMLQWLAMWLLLIKSWYCDIIKYFHLNELCSISIPGSHLWQQLNESLEKGCVMSGWKSLLNVFLGRLVVRIFGILYFYSVSCVMSYSWK